MPYGVLFDLIPSFEFVLAYVIFSYSQTHTSPTLFLGRQLLTTEEIESRCSPNVACHTYAQHLYNSLKTDLG